MSNLTPPSPFAEKPTRHPTLCWSGYRAATMTMAMFGCNERQLFKA
jgi:hypothetical protein